jgi:hypothetical protein
MKCLSLRLAAYHCTRSLVITLGRLALRGLLIIALVGILMRWTAYHGAGPLIIALDRILTRWTAPRILLRRPTYACDGSLMLATAHLFLRRLAYTCDGSLMLATAHLSLRRPAHVCDGPLMLAMARSCLRRPTNACDLL